MLSASYCIEVRQRRRFRHPPRLMGLSPGVWKVIEEYCQQSSLHGLKYISNTNLPYIERYIWLVVFLSCFGYAVFLIYELWLIYKQKPFLITFDSHMTPIWDVPFPAITICPYFTVKKSSLDLSSAENNTALFYASLICPMDQILKTRVSELDYIGNEFYDFVKQVSPTCNDILKRCSFAMKEIDCCEHFDPVLTPSGLCYTFNILPLEKLLNNNTYIPFPSRDHPPNARFWNPQDGYPFPDLRGQNDSYVYPIWEQMAGENFGLFLELFQNQTEWQQQCSGAYSGFKILVTNPADLPLFPKVSSRVSMDRETNIMLTPQTLRAQFDIAPIPPETRSCVFTGERELQFFNQYTDDNCNIDCLSKEFVTQCGCVPYFLPHLKSTRICSRRKDSFCIHKARTNITRSAMVKSKSRHQECDCLKGCQEVTYRSVDFYSDFIYTGTREPPWAGSNKLGPHQVTKVAVHFRTNQFLGKHRSIQYTFLKFAGTCGGLLSLLMGFSVISVIEVVYAFLLRPLSRRVHEYCHQLTERTRKNVIAVQPTNPSVQRQPMPINTLSITGLYNTNNYNPILF